MKIIESIKNMKPHFKLLISIFAISVLVVAIVVIFSKKEPVETHAYEKDVVDISNIQIYSNDVDTKIIEEATIPTFMYHNVTDDMSYIEYSENAVSVKGFEEQLKAINDGGYTSIFFDDIQHLQNISKPVMLTFDDGFIDFYENVFPLLKKYNIKATLFMIVGYINCPYYCTLDSLKEMEKSGLVKIESHTVTHPDLSSLSQDKLLYEINESKDKLKEYLNIDSTVICYPFGLNNKKVIDECSKLYKYGVLMDEGIYNTKKNSEFYIPRIYVNRSMSITKFKQKLSNSNVVVK